MMKKPPRETTAGRISAARLTRLTRQNEKLEIEVQRLRGEVGPIEEFKQMVLKANAVVRLQFLALSHRLSPTLAPLSDPRDIQRIMDESVIQACNDLAFERERPQETCPTCGTTMKEKPE
jgi:hypothetical protein